MVTEVQQKVKNQRTGQKLALCHLVLTLWEAIFWLIKKLEKSFQGQTYLVNNYQNTTNLKFSTLLFANIDSDKERYWKGREST